MGLSSQTIATGDLVRWTSPLYYIEDGKEHVVSRWCYALVVRVKLGCNLELRVIGKHAPVFPIAVAVEKLLNGGEVQVLEGGGKWRTLQSLD